MPDPTPRPRFLLTLEALPPLADEPPAELRLRAALKVLLRRFRLRCLRAEAVREEPVPPPSKGAEVATDFRPHCTNGWAATERSPSCNYTGGHYCELLACHEGRCRCACGVTHAPPKEEPAQEEAS